jgi:hypothetical protein
MTRVAMLLASLLPIAACPTLAAEPIRIGITTILSGPTADRGQSELITPTMPASPTSACRLPNA